MPEIDIEFIEEKARRLGVTYRADIKPETLLKKVEDAEAKASKKPDVSLPAQYKNTTLQNIFTSSGRCKPQGVVTIPANEADKIAGLDLVKA